tara:strand:+ start:1519 stop:2448 length:930 start_codon:yes stop_codon:yes gene_type:complete
MRKVILLTGANGFIGKNVLKSFHKKYEIIAFSRSKPKFDSKWIKFNGLNDSKIQEIFKKYKPHFIINCAAIAHKNLRFFKNNHKLIEEVNLEYINILLDCALKNDLPSKFIFISSIGVYKKQSSLVINENSLLSPNNYYSELKLKGEKIIQKRLKGSKVSWTILRIPMVYGNNAPGNFNLLVNLIDLQVPLILENKKNYRTLLSINNLMSALKRIISVKKSDNQIYLVSDDEKISLRDLIKNIGLVRNKSSLIITVPNYVYSFLKKLPFVGKKFEVVSNEYIIDNSKIKKQLNWYPPYKLNAEIKKVFI